MMMAVRPPVLPQFGCPPLSFGCRNLPGYGQPRETIGQSRASSTRRSLCSRDIEVAGSMSARLQERRSSEPGVAVSKVQLPKPRVAVARPTAVPAAPTKRQNERKASEYLPDAEARPVDKLVVDALEVVLTHIAAPASAPGTPRSVFHAKNVPRMPIGDYFARMRKYFNCSNECFVIALVYIDRLARNHPEMVVDNMSCHRLFIVSTIVALKFQDDDYHDNAYYATVGGLSVPELNKLEREFVRMLDWKLHVDVPQFVFYRDMMLKAVGDGKGSYN